MKFMVLKLSAVVFSAVLFMSMFPAMSSLAYNGGSLTRIGDITGTWLIREFGTMFEYDSDSEAEATEEADETEKDGEFMIHPGMRFNRSMMMKV